METNANYTLVGFFVIVLFITIVIVIVWLSAGISQKNYKIYQTHMYESVAGLDVQAPVKYNGVKVGSVSNIKLNLQNPQEVILTLQIDPDVPITETTRSILMQQGITGIAYLGLRGGSTGKQLLPEPGEQYAVIKSSPSLFVRLDATLESLGKNLSTLSESLTDLFTPENRTALKNILHKFPIVLESFRSAANNISRTSTEVGKTMRSSKMPLQQLSTQVIPEAYSTLESVHNVSKNLEGLTDELSQNPSVIFSGRQPPPKGPGE